MSRRPWFLSCALWCVVACDRNADVERVPVTPEAAAPAARWGLVIHGGAGTIDPSKLTPEQEREYRATLDAALDAGYAVPLSQFVRKLLTKNANDSKVPLWHEL